MTVWFLNCTIYNFRRISDGLEEALPNLESIILTGNSIQELGDIDCLAKLPHLRTLSLLYNPIQNKPHYRLYIAFKIPQLKVLDFCKIKMKVIMTCKAEYKRLKNLFVFLLLLLHLLIMFTF